MNAASVLIEMLDRAIGHDRPSVISIEGHGSISIYPHQRAYNTDIRDWRALPFSDAGAIRAGAAVWGSAPEDSSPVSELRWLAAYHQACAHGARDACSPGLAKLRHWPDLSTVPTDMAPEMIRMCALLWRKPTATTLIPRILGADPERTCALLAVLQAFGHVEIVAQLAAERSEERPPSQPAAVAESPQASVIARLWQRLIG
jgi:hypothetical protein